MDQEKLKKFINELKIKGINASLCKRPVLNINLAKEQKTIISC